MTYTDDCTLPAEMLEQIASQGFDALPELIRIVINTAMQAERQKYLRAAPFEHLPERQGHANGYKPKTDSRYFVRALLRTGRTILASFWPLSMPWRYSRNAILLRQFILIRKLPLPGLGIKSAKRSCPKMKRMS